MATMRTNVGHTSTNAFSAKGSSIGLLQGSLITKTSMGQTWANNYRTKQGKLPNSSNNWPHLEDNTNNNSSKHRASAGCVKKQMGNTHIAVVYATTAGSLSPSAEFPACERPLLLSKGNGSSKCLGTEPGASWDLQLTPALDSTDILGYCTMCKKVRLLLWAHALQK